MVLLLIILPLALSLLLTIPLVQSFVVQVVADAASRKIDSRVEIGGVGFSLSQHLTLYDVMVEDLGGEPMLSAREINAKLASYKPLSKSLTLRYVKVSDSELRLREMPDSVINIKQIVDKLTNPEKAGQFRTVIDEVELQDMDFSLSRLEHKNPVYGVDLGNIRFEGISARAVDLVSHQGVMQLTIEQFGGVEQSGLSIDSSQAALEIRQGVVDFIGFKAETPYSSLNLPRLLLEASSWEEYKDFNANVSLDIVSAASTLAASDVAYFAPALEEVYLEVHGISATASGTIDELNVQLDNLILGENSRLVGSVRTRGIAEPQSAWFDLDVERLITSARDIDYVITCFGSVGLEAQARSIIASLGRFEVASTVVGSFDDMTLDVALKSQLGQATYSGVVRDASGALAAEGVATTTNLQLGTLLSNEQLGSATMSAQVRYKELPGALDAWVSGSVANIGYNSCTYSNINLEASYDGEILESSVWSNDSKFDFNLAALLNLGEQRHYDLTLRVKNADLHAMALNGRDSISRLSGSVRVNLGGNSVDNLSGTVSLRNINYAYNDKSIYAPSISLTARNNDQSKYIALESDFVDMVFSSKSSFNALYDYIRNGMHSYIPLLYDKPTERNHTKKITLADNYSTLTVDFKSISEVADALVGDLSIADNSSLNVMVNPFSKRFSMRLESDYIQHNSLAATGLSINASNDNDSLSLYATAADIFMGRTSFSSYTLMAGARDNVVELSTGFRDLASATSATLGMQVRFDRDKRADIVIRPSNITIGEDVWMISARDIEGKGNRLSINNFEMVNGSQQLHLNGVISKEPTDSLILQLDNYDIGMITSVINDLGYSVKGFSNGYINMREILANPRIVADVKLDSVEVNSIPSPPLNLLARWDATRNRAGVSLTNRESRDTVVMGYYAPSDMRYYARLKVDSLNAGLIDPLLKTTISDTRGFANVDVTLQGQHKQASLHGGINIYDIETQVIFTQVEYKIPSAYIAVDDNKFTAQAQEIFDSEGNRGLATLNLSLDHLSNVSYRLRLVPEKMMVLNTTEQDNELFYGRLYGSGVATIEGDKRGVNMDITATSEANSSFFMPLSTKSSIAKTDFITFVQERNQEQEPSSTVNFRRNFMDERQRRGNQATAQVNINMALHVTPDLDFQLVIDPVVGDIIKARGEGRMNLNIAPQENLFEMYGDYSITEGNYLFALLNPITKRFVIDSGSSIQWTGDPIDPVLDIDAVYKVKTSLDPLINSTSTYSSESSSRAVPVDCIIHLGDRLSQPSVDFSIEVPTADTEQQAVIANTLIDQETISQQFFYLMLANSFISVSTSYGSGLTGSTTASTGFELLTNQLSNWLSSSNYNVVIRYRPESELTSDEVDVGFSRGLIDNRLLIEVEGNYLADNKTAIEGSSVSNFMGEAYVTWLIDKAGALRLKGFTQTIDRYDENQGLQETGIGLYYSESFETFKELKRKVADRFRRKKREEESEASDVDEEDNE